MGLSIHYSGYIRDSNLLDPLIVEVKDVCETPEWERQIIDGSEIKGICFAPKGSEPVSLAINYNGQLLSPVNIVVKDIYDDVQLEKQLIFTTSPKTQLAGLGAHIAIIKLLKYISSKYLSGFKLNDERYYWETGNEKLLLSQFKKNDAAINKISNAMESLPTITDETAESLVNRLERLLRKNFGGKNE